MNFEEDEFKDPDEAELSGSMLDDGLDEVFDDDVEPIEPELIAGELPEEEESADDL